MQIVIDIPDFTYELVKEYVNEGLFDYNGINATLHKSVANGTVLPKGHGRLIDISEYEKYFNTEIVYDDGNHIHSVYTSMISTIIEADKEQKDTGFFDEIMNESEEDEETYEKINEIIEKVKEQEE